MNIGPLLDATTTFSSLALVSSNAKFLRKKKKKANDFINLGVGNVVGSALIKEQADFINS